MAAIRLAFGSGARTIMLPFPSSRMKVKRERLLASQTNLAPEDCKPYQAPSSIHGIVRYLWAHCLLSGDLKDLFNPLPEPVSLSSYITLDHTSSSVPGQGTARVSTCSSGHSVGTASALKPGYHPAHLKDKAKDRELPSQIQENGANRSPMMFNF